MMIKIAVFGCTDIVRRLQACTADDPHIELSPFIYDDPSETTDLLEKAPLCDVYLFTEVQSFLPVKPLVERKRLPAILIPHDSYTVITSLFRAQNRLREHFSRLSIDVWHRHHIDEAIGQLEEESHDVYTCYYGDDSTSYKAISSFHCRLWEEGKIDHVLTSVKEVEQRLRQGNIPVTCMTVSDTSLRNAISQAKEIITLNKNTVQLVAGHIQIKNTSMSGKANEAVLKQLHRDLTQFAIETDAFVTKAADGEFILFGSQKLLNYITGHYRDFPLLRLIRNTLKEPVAIGFGLGLNSRQAESNAQRALEKCFQDGSSCCYIVNERQDTIGPLGVKKHFDTARLYRALIHKARLNNDLSYNFIDFITHRNNEPFSSNDIASFYQVTKRSAERTINKLLSGEVIKVVGEEKPYVKGRPRKLFKIKME